MKPTRSKRICLVSTGHPSTNPRLVKEANALAEAGYSVTVIAGNFLAWAERADREFANRTWTLRYVQFGPRAPWYVYLYQALRRRACAALAPRVGYTSWLVECGFHDILPTLKSMARGCRADLYIAHNLGALPAAVRAAALNGARAGFDAEDFHSGELVESSASQSAIRMAQTLEGLYLPRCDYVTAAAPEIAREYARIYGIKLPRTVLNVFSLSDRPNVVRKKSAAGRRTLYWFSQTIGPHRGLETAIEAISESRVKPDLCLLGQISSSYRATLNELAIELGVGDRLRFIETAAPRDMVRIAAEHDAGLACEVACCRNRELALTNKIFAYLMAGIPVLASNTMAQAQFARGHEDCVFLYDAANARGLSAVIDRVLGDADQLALASRAAQALAENRYNWELERKGFLAAIHATLERS